MVRGSSAASGVISPMAEPDMAAALPHDGVAELLEDTAGLPSGDDGKPGRHRVTTTVPTRTREGSGMTSPWACMSSRQSSMASRMLSSAPSTVSPWL